MMMTRNPNVGQLSGRTSAAMQNQPVVSEKLTAMIEQSCDRIAPLWPLKHFVAVNPFFGLADLPFQQASDTLARITGNGIYMDRPYYREQFASGRISRSDIQEAIRRCESGLAVEDVVHALSEPAPTPRLGMAPVSEILERVEGGLWSSFVTERISLHCAAYFDLGQAMVKLPWRGQTLYESWRIVAEIDHSPAMMGLSRFRHAVAGLPADPLMTIALAVEELGIPESALERYLHASLISIGGWASWARYLRWQAELSGHRDAVMTDMLAIRLAWDILLYREKFSAALTARWREMLSASMRPPSAKRQASAEIDRIMLIAMEVGYQRQLIAGMVRSGGATTAETIRGRPDVQAAFCIDVRSEVFRRALETVAPGAQTLGFAGFFGIFIQHVPLGSAESHVHVPVLFSPAYCIQDQVETGRRNRLVSQRRKRIAMAKAWKGFKYSATSCFSFVEATGLKYGIKLMSDSLGWTRPVPDPHSQGLAASVMAQIRPDIDSVPSDEGCEHGGLSGIPETDRASHAERILKSMSLTGPFARLVLLVGHGSSSVNNPHATGLDCGACAGQTGEASARVVAALLNDDKVRATLQQRGIRIPDDTWFLPALHDTTTDDVRIFDHAGMPAVLADDLVRLQQWLEQAGDLARMERGAALGLQHLSDNEVSEQVRARSRDWSQLRPEWALANNAAFIAAPRGRTVGMDLQGRAFLHEYDWRADTDFQTLKLIMTAPMVVANWINMPYYGSVVDNRRYGSGNKFLHNVAGGAIGVLEGNGGDLRVGLPLQSLHNGREWVHEPLRLSVFIEAPEQPIDDIIAGHALVAQLVANRWLHIFRLDEDGKVYRRLPEGGWEDATRYL